MSTSALAINNLDPALNFINADNESICFEWDSDMELEKGGLETVQDTANNTVKAFESLSKAPNILDNLLLAKFAKTSQGIITALGDTISTLKSCVKRTNTHTKVLQSIEPWMTASLQVMKSDNFKELIQEERTA